MGDAGMPRYTHMHVFRGRGQCAWYGHTFVLALINMPGRPLPVTGALAVVLLLALVRN